MEDNFGGSVSLSNDGTTFAVSAFQLYNDDSQSKQGCACVYRYEPNTWNWLGNEIDIEPADDQSCASLQCVPIL